MAIKTRRDYDRVDHELLQNIPSFLPFPPTGRMVHRRSRPQPDPALYEDLRSKHFPDYEFAGVFRKTEMYGSGIEA